MRKFGTVKVGSSGTDVIVLQTILRMLGCLDYNGKQIDIDGEFGQLTLYAVESLQKWSNSMGTKMRTDGTFDESCFKKVLRY